LLRHLLFIVVQLKEERYCCITVIRCCPRTVHSRV